MSDPVAPKTRNALSTNLFHYDQNPQIFCHPIEGIWIFVPIGN